MASVQTEAAIFIITELYGEPEWISKPRSGQNVNAILAEWDQALKGYSEEQVKTAVRKLWKYAKTKTPPRLGHLVAQLVDVEPEAERPETKQRAGIADDTEQTLIEQYVKNGCRGYLCFASDVEKAFKVMFADMIAALPDEATSGKTHSDLLRMARNNGYLERMETYLAGITSNRPLYQPIGDELRFIDVPADFSPNNKKRKCA